MVNWPPGSGSVIQDNWSKDPDPEPKKIIKDPEPVFQIRMFLGLLDPDPLFKGGTDSGGASESFPHQAKII